MHRLSNILLFYQLILLISGQDYGLPEKYGRNNYDDITEQPVKEKVDVKNANKLIDIIMNNLPDIEEHIDKNEWPLNKTDTLELNNHMRNITFEVVHDFMEDFVAITNKINNGETLQQDVVDDGMSDKDIDTFVAKLKKRDIPEDRLWPILNKLRRQMKIAKDKTKNIANSTKSVSLKNFILSESDSLNVNILDWL